MNNYPLLSSKYKVLGWILFILFGSLGIASMYFSFSISFLQLPEPVESGFGDWTDHNLTNEIALAGTVLGLLIIAFSKEVVEDEYISFLRLGSWQWSIFISYILLIVLNFVFYGGAFYAVLIYNVFLLPIVFIIKFNYSLYRLRSERNRDEK